MAITRVGVIGTGVIGEALIKALLVLGVSPTSIQISEKQVNRKQEVINQYGVAVFNSAEDVDVLLIAVKPQDFKETLKELGSFQSNSPLVISFAAGIKIEKIEEQLGAHARVIRVMPNTPISMGRGMSALSAGSNVTPEDVKWTKRFLSASGQTIMVDEKLQDAVTATSGSGPAYYFAFTEAVAAAGERLGLSKVDATLLARETLIGAALMIEKSDKDLVTLRDNVTSPNGTTAAALKSLQISGFNEIIYEAMKSARDRSIELSQ
jgi:pyrroline-5-carboxylate reductase